MFEMRSNIDSQTTSEQVRRLEASVNLTHVEHVQPEGLYKPYPLWTTPT